MDDEPAVLAGLRKVLHKERERWEMTFCAGSDEALLVLARQSFDMVVSDMRMPGMDGASLLEHVRRESPRTVRIMLSGSADKEELDRAMSAVDELLGKPCDTKTLRATIERLMDTHVV